jgi:hypothetical protein
VAEQRAYGPSRRRSAWLMYGVLLISGGLFAFIWLVMLMRDINSVERRAVFPTSPLAATLFIGLLCYFYLIFGPPAFGTQPGGISTTRLAATVILGVGLNLLYITLLILICRHVKVALGSRFGAIDGIVVVVLTILIGLSLVLVQSQLNILVERRISEIDRSA